MKQMKEKIVSGVLLDDECSLTLGELSRACAMHAEWVMELVEEGIIEPLGGDLAQWRFSPRALYRARTVRNLQRDLGVNLSGAALALELLEEIEALRARLRRFDPGC